MTLTLTNLTKQYGNFTALENFTLDCSAAVSGLLRTNGVGKSAILNNVSNNRKPTSRSVKFDLVETSTMVAFSRKIFVVMVQQRGI